MSSLTPIAIHAVPHPDLGGVLPPPAVPLPLPLPQTRLWRDTFEILGGEVQALGPAGLKGFATITRLPGLRGALGPLARVARGVRGLTVDKARALRPALDRRHLVVHATSPEEGSILATAGFRQIAPQQKTATIFIDRRPKELLRAMSPDWRTALKQATGQELVVRRSPLPPDPNHWIFDEWDGGQGTMCRTDDSALSRRFIAGMAATDPGGVQIFSVTREGRRLAVMLVLRHGTGSTCVLARTSPAGREISADHLCLWRTMLQLRELGVQWLDLGPADWRTDAPAATFLSGAGASLRAHGGAWLDSAWLPRQGTRSRATDRALGLGSGPGELAQSGAAPR